MAFSLKNITSGFIFCYKWILRFYKSRKSKIDSIKKSFAHLKSAHL